MTHLAGFVGNYAHAAQKIHAVPEERIENRHGGGWTGTTLCGIRYAHVTPGVTYEGFGVGYDRCQRCASSIGRDMAV